MERSYLADLGIGGRIILKSLLKDIGCDGGD
jgi:hypothetical protein